MDVRTRPEQEGTRSFEWSSRVDGGTERSICKWISFPIPPVAKSAQTSQTYLCSAPV